MSPKIYSRDDMPNDTPATIHLAARLIVMEGLNPSQALHEARIRLSDPLTHRKMNQNVLPPREKITMNITPNPLENEQPIEADRPIINQHTPSLLVTIRPDLADYLVRHALEMSGGETISQMPAWKAGLKLIDDPDPAVRALGYDLALGTVRMEGYPADYAGVTELHIAVDVYGALAFMLHHQAAGKD
jgi:hypothetical protein